MNQKIHTLYIGILDSQNNYGKVRYYVGSYYVDQGCRIYAGLFIEDACSVIAEKKEKKMLDNYTYSSHLGT